MKYLKQFKMFLEKKREYDFGCVLIELDFPEDFWNNLISQIDEDDLYKPEVERYSKETEPHVTVLYGIENDVDDKEVVDICKSFNGSDIKITCTNLECFQNKEFDVIKLTIDSPKLHEINSALKKVKHTDSYPTYKPHATIAFLKPGMGPKYCRSIKPIIIDDIHNITYSKTSGDDIIINMQ